MIRFDTTNPPGNERECIQFINGLLRDAGIKTTLLSKSRQRPNLVARLASVISPAKLQNASASIDRIGEEASVLRVTFMVSLVITAVAAALALAWAV